MASVVQNRSFTSAPSDGSRTITVLDLQPRPEGDPSQSGDSQTVGTLRLRGGPRRIRPHVAWGEDVIDNEGSGKKKSKICCIYRKPRRYDESSSDESSDSDSDSDAHSDTCNSSHKHSHRHRLPNGSGDGITDHQSSGGVHESDSERNAYEVVPQSKRER